MLKSTRNEIMVVLKRTDIRINLLVGKLMEPTEIFLRQRFRENLGNFRIGSLFSRRKFFRCGNLFPDMEI